MTRTLLVPEKVISLQFIERWPTLLELISYVTERESLSDPEYEQAASQEPRARRTRCFISERAFSLHPNEDQSPSHLQPNKCRPPCGGGQMNEGWGLMDYHSGISLEEVKHPVLSKGAYFIFFICKGQAQRSDLPLIFKQTIVRLFSPNILLLLCFHVCTRVFLPNYMWDCRCLNESDPLLKYLYHKVSAKRSM